MLFVSSKGFCFKFKTSKLGKSNEIFLTLTSLLLEISSSSN